jgi:hypothetical protein
MEHVKFGIVGIISTLTRSGYGDPMAEVMAVEAIIDAYWQLQGFWSKPRFAFQTLEGGWSDTDVLAYHPENRHLVIAESKVQGNKKLVMAFTSEIQKKLKHTFFEHEQGDYFKFVNHVGIICGKVFKSFPAMVQTLTIQLVSNYYLSDDVKENTVNQVRAHVVTLLKHDNVKVLLQTTLEVFAEIIRLERVLDQGKRYGNPVIDIARELNRYTDPGIRMAGRDTQEIRKRVIKPLTDVLNLQ